jgi:NADP-dependent 3-hydroxy acid dehydrogenase YdfG
LENQESSHWDAMLKYNVIGTLRTARTFMPLLKNKSGKSLHYVGQVKNVPPNSDPGIRIYST